MNTLEAQLAATVGSVGQLNEELQSAVSRTIAERAKLDLARMRVKQHRELADSGAGTDFALNRPRPTSGRRGNGLLQTSLAEAQVRARLGATVGDDQAEVAQIKAQLANARWEPRRLSSTRPPTAR